MYEDYDIDFEQKSARQSTVFGIVVSLIGITLYVQQIVQRNNISGDEWIFPIMYGGLSGIVGFLFGLTFFKSKNPYGLLAPFIVFFIHAFFFGSKGGDNFGEFMFQAFYLLLSLGITFLIFLLSGFLSVWIKQGK